MVLPLRLKSLVTRMPMTPLRLKRPMKAELAGHQAEAAICRQSC
jgi:hypothetical protein